MTFFILRQYLVATGPFTAINAVLEDALGTLTASYSKKGILLVPFARSVATRNRPSSVADTLAM